MDIYNNDNVRLYGFCALESSENLNSIWFALPKTQMPPESVYIVLNDRACEHEYTSNSVTICSFIGNWLNEDPETGGITRVEIVLNGSDLRVHEWGACLPVDCDWGTQITPVEDAQDDILNVSWNPGFVVRNQSLEIVEVNRLMVTTFSHYIDSSGRPDVTDIYYFTK
ncbi:MAG: hypothetical protein KKD44_00755 [Proteobacteria bacterium]|nr:hypothetical protein [Pseudomonadota bacterium]